MLKKKKAVKALQITLLILAELNSYLETYFTFLAPFWRRTLCY
jgi:hypothetical protein